MSFTTEMGEEPRRLRCTWERDDEGNWDTECGEGWLRDAYIIFGEGGPSENGMRFCCFCGGKLEVAE